MTYIDALDWSSRLLGWAVLLQSIEMICLRSCWSDSGIWRWQDLRQDYRAYPLVSRTLSLFLNSTSYLALNILTFLAAIGLMMIGLGGEYAAFAPYLLGLVFFSILDDVDSLSGNVSWRKRHDDDRDFFATFYC
jgi:hypothetical protein